MLRCHSCKYWDTSVQLTAAERDTTGACRATLPVVDFRTSEGRWPITEYSDWCRHHSAEVPWPFNPSEDPSEDNYIPF